ncbi:trigger factor [Nitratidesulfovibrio vulgaris]|uniref:Trigger factor n=1 Tax=Nitratidesulfovibrio vulgaris (strain ATCC 29579 / DSM 644 / CCUG 34227 / NCIMB 8303 / VKM B-1760 / Hildenborough) TaxID=882 RepID=TIG_NITV2|nr:trigger factor [Nitratidesulfovibrio vulgaris]Q72CE9.1 RecName: Full=Trigger factor; Short=TF; AltName: Full=PPIase [Nitratidesulfovibrio vulgaris str. Hildenborough]AAS95812.1 trigger factor [Nitratidesulfovibrio vulgaris str. Hildenborough]ADP86389.1 trigger factor [Nitratidesulfovibrio vulgaris RCH1]
MEYKVEDVSPVKKKVNVTVPVEEVDAALGAAIAMYRTSVNLDGFRKGKVPASIVENRFRKEIYAEATQDLVNVHINEIVTSLAVSPLSRIDFDGGELERGKEFSYTISFEVMPQFDLPDYEGFAVEQEKAVVDEKEVDEVIARIRRNMAELVPVAETRPGADGDVVVLDFAAFENGEPIEGVSAENFQLSLGEKQSLEDFENLVKTIPAGQEAEGPITFPDDFLNPDFAGKTVTMKVKVHAVKERRLPEIDDALAQKAGGFESMEKMRETVVTSYMQSREQLHKATAQKSMLDKLLKMVDFALPESMVDMYVGNLIEDMRVKMERQGRGLESLGKTPEQLREQVLPEAQQIARSQIFLLAAGRKEAVEVSEQEVDGQLQQLAMRSGQDFDTLKDYYVRNGLIFNLRDRLIADKAMDAIYAKANVTMVDPAPAA